MVFFSQTAPLIRNGDKNGSPRFFQPRRIHGDRLTQNQTAVTDSDEMKTGNVPPSVQNGVQRARRFHQIKPQHGIAEKNRLEILFQSADHGFITRRTLKQPVNNDGGFGRRLRDFPRAQKIQHHVVTQFKRSRRASDIERIQQTASPQPDRFLNPPARVAVPIHPVKHAAECE